MEGSDEFYRKVQMYLMKKNQECAELRYLTSRTTEESINHIEDVCKSMTEIFESQNIPIKEKASLNNERCVQAYKYLVLNTYFKSQERLAEDIINGHLVDMCPPLSPYLLIQILWNLEYEKIFIRSLLYMPFEFCTEILEIIRNCMEELPFQRSIESIYELILTLYVKLFQLKEIGLQSANPAESIEIFLINFKEVLLLLTNSKITRLTELKNLKKYERYGVMLKKLIRTVRNCLEYKTQEIFVSTDLEKLYTITFGREPFIKSTDSFIENTRITLNTELMELLLNKIKEIDCNIYLGWSELDDKENNMISLQRSIGIECYYFIEFIKNDEQLSQCTHLTECLEQLSSKPDSKQESFVLSIQEVCYAIGDGKKELVKELLCRYKEWDGSVLDFVYKNRSLLDNKDYLNLLEYLTFVLRDSTDEDFKQFSYTLVIRMLSLQNIPDIYEIVIMYITKHDGKNNLESPHTEEMFHNFITRSVNFRTPRNLKIILLFLLKNPRKILTTLLKITIGSHPQYKNIMISGDDLLLLSPFMQIRDDNNELFLTSILRTICIENAEWNTKKFRDLIQDLINCFNIGIDDLINNVFIPYLEENIFNVSNINTILHHVRKFQSICPKDTNVKGLIIVLAKKMFFLRKSTNISKYVMTEIFVQITRILEYFLERKGNRLSASTKGEIINEIESYIEPIDKKYFAPLWHLTQKGVSIIDIIQDYERCCFFVLNKLKEDPNTPERLRNYLSDLNLLREEFLRHLIIRSTEKEYLRLASELTIIYWFAFGWNDEIEACHHFLRLTIEACCLSLEYPSIGGNDLFAFLIKSFTSFCTLFVKLERMKGQERVYQSVIENINVLGESIKNSPYAHLFTTFLAQLNDVQHNSDDPLKDVLYAFYHFSQQCLDFNYECNVETPRIPHSPKVSNFYITYEVISTCMKVPMAEAYESIRQMNNLF